MEKVAVIGGGIAGLLASILLAKANKKVHLIDKEEEVGGLLRSFINEDGIAFDYGTHVPAETMLKEVDEVLFPDMESKGWESFDILKPGNYFQGKLYPKNQMIYTPFLKKEIYNQGLIDLLNTEPIEGETANCKEYTEKFFGKTFSEHIFAPLLRKLQGHELDELHPLAYLLFGYNRLVPGDEFMARELKRSDFYSEKVSYATFYEGVSPQTKYYPSDRGGVGKWVKQIVETAKEFGVEFITGNAVESVKHSNGEVKQLTLTNGTTIEVDHVVWTIAPYLFLKSAGVAFESQPPKFREMTIHHYVIDKPFIPRNFFIYCNDDRFDSFRITLYPNITNAENIKPPYNCTVEVLSDRVDNLENYNEKIFQELIDLEIVSKDAEVLYRQVQQVENGFPVYTNQFVKDITNQKNLMEQGFKNVTIAGKANGVSFFMHEVLVETYEIINKLIKG